ncbi:hypothetical protein SV7mr_42780 [Stieleria bergensis]|uniref:Uncharacterized protein n=1 Tax=Stieleria bergensis TaxID=2528025 RepID=A0A517T019_9BACT|nr:hypothetical protein SV7mr_42780 [Planctomycetes bacterium SV_7m_r]
MKWYSVVGGQTIEPATIRPNMRGSIKTQTGLVQESYCLSFIPR